MSQLSITNEDGQEVILYTPSEKQEEFHKRTEPNVLFWGGRGSGKSMALRWEAHARALAYPGFRYCILRRTSPQLQESHLVHIHKEMKQLGGYFHGTKLTAFYPNGSRGVFRHCAGEEDVLNLLSTEFMWMGFDELSTFEWDMFTKLSASVRVNKGTNLIAMVRACTNPLGPSAEEIMHYFVEKDVDKEQDEDYAPDDWYSVHANADDNPYLDLKQYKKRFSGLASHVKKAWLDGEFVLENAIFDVHPKIKIKVPVEPTESGGGTSGAPAVLSDRFVEKIIPYHYIEQLDVDKIVKAGQIYRAYDHGYFPDPAVCLWIAHLGHRYVVFHEQLWKKTIAAEIADEIVEISKQLGITRTAITYADPTIDVNTGADIRTIKDIMEGRGVPIECSVNSRELYAAHIHTALGEEAEPNVPKLQIYTKGCPYLCATLPKQRFDPKHPLRMADSKSDHAAIALAYFLISSGSMDKNSIMAESSVRPWMRQKNNARWILGHESVRKN